ncbi:RNA-binding protein involved in meiosis Mei2 [Schizosaccharomyces osmophilus]|uniref:RNA-binding protein involved in meiosis Mei2 n=1 Tax=Schizosaccharomyces osmophilus TaxID=2545709 RepID=A0AAE9WCU9_9SCHI|nr:RNA-binding protein involved in meiosis Mei2 [Schizosaccharomyces osmophilus]WBW73830.1 RNA-binding protein involved in meiosis Mei2 [Schizosaccharomyces osmophilus]
MMASGSSLSLASHSSSESTFQIDMDKTLHALPSSLLDSPLLSNCGDSYNQKSGLLLNNIHHNKSMGLSNNNAKENSTGDRKVESIPGLTYTQNDENAFQYSSVGLTSADPAKFPERKIPSKGETFSERQPLGSWQTNVAPSESPPQASTYSDYAVPNGVNPLQSNNQYPTALHRSASYPGPSDDLDMFSSASRYLFISNLPRIVPYATLLELFSRFGDVKGLDTSALSTDGICIVAFFDVRQAIQTAKILRTQRFFNDRLLSFQICQRSSIQRMINQGAPIQFLDDNEGQLLFTMQGQVTLSIQQLQSILQTFGPLLCLKPLRGQNPSQILCEFYDTRDASFALDELDGRIIHNCCLQVSYYDAMVDSVSSSSVSSHSVNKSINSAQPPNDWMYPFTNNGQEATPLLKRTSSNLGSQYSTLSNSLRSVPLGRTESSPAWGTGGHYDLLSTSPTVSVNNSRRPMSASRYSMDVSPIAPPTSGRGKQRAVDLLNGYSGQWNPFTASSLKGVDSPTNAVGMRRSLTVDANASRANPANLSFASLTLHDSRADPAAFCPAPFYGAGENTFQGLSAVPERPISMDRNSVDYARVAAGLDHRTTVMIKNIPNKFTQQMLREYIDLTNQGTYDFLYLRIDFVNKCNVGYAFINFIDPEAIVTFGKARVGTQWNVFHSEKICDISYANIQGKERLIEKFRNSCVMDENPAYRPKIFVSHGPNRGMEEPFPAPNNARRKLRSIASAQQIGLFPPTASKC